MKINTHKRVLQISIFSVGSLTSHNAHSKGVAVGLVLLLTTLPDCKSLTLVSGIETLNHHNIITLCVPYDANSVASEKQPLKGVLIRKKLLNPKSVKPQPCVRIFFITYHLQWHFLLISSHHVLHPLSVSVCACLGLKRSKNSISHTEYHT